MVGDAHPLNVSWQKLSFRLRDIHPSGLAMDPNFGNKIDGDCAARFLVERGFAISIITDNDNKIRE